MGHDHHGHATTDERSLVERLRALAARKVLLGMVLTIALLTGLGLLLLWPGNVEPVTTLEGESFFGERVEATVEQVTTEDCSFSPTPGEFLCDLIEFVVTNGTPDGERGDLEFPLGAGGARIQDGDELILSYAFDAPPGAQFQFSDFQRSTPMLVLAAAFAVVVVAFGRWRGLFAIIGVGVSLVVLIAFVLPALLEGSSPLLVALVGASAVALPALYLAHGASERTSVAVIGTVSSLLLTCLLGVVFVEATHLTGLVSDEVGFLQAFGGDLDFEGLLLAGMVIGALGVLDDVTVTQVAAVWELADARPRARAADLYRAGVRIGRDHIASTVNTLVLAYAGASLPLLLLFVTSGRQLGHVVTTEAIAVEVVRALVGSIGLVASVPITTGLAAAVVTRDRARSRVTASS
ncbi:MAG: YibE/F family protein [Acidimicrobiia bacterium]